MRRCVLTVGSLALLALPGCGGADDGGAGPGPGGGGGTTIADQPLTGKIGGQPFTFATGETVAFLSMDDTYYLNLYSTAFSACESGGRPFEASSVIMSLPKMSGAYDLGLAHNATLYDGPANFNHIATRGRIAVDSIVGSTITGGANITFDANNAVNGKFTATICP